MNPLNKQQTILPATQYYMAGPPPLTPATATSILKTSNATTASSSDNTKCGTSTNYLPVLLTNQTLLSSGQHFPTNFTTSPQTIFAHSPVISGHTNTNMPLLSSNGNGTPVLLPSANTKTGNFTYQVLPTPPTNLTPAASNGTVSVLLASSQPMVTAGHVSAPIIIRNTPTTANKTNVQQQTKSHSLNPQSFSPDILKQIVVGNPGPGTTTANLAPRTTLLKPTILQNKTLIPQHQQLQQLEQNPHQQQQIQNKSLVNNTKMMIPTSQQIQQQNINKRTVITATTNDNSSQITVTQNVQKFSQVSLLQKSTKKALNKTEILNDVLKTAQKNANEMKLENLKGEVSLTENPNNVTLLDNKSKEIYLLKNSNKTKADIGDKRKLKKFDKSNNKNTNSNNNKEEEVARKDTNESYSLLKFNNGLKQFFEDDSNTIKFANTLGEKQESLLKSKSNNNKSPSSKAKNIPEVTSPRSQRSNSCNTIQEAQPTNATTYNERRHSEPLKTKDNQAENQDMEIDIYFEDEEYLECSGDKLSIDFEKPQVNDNSIQNNQQKTKNNKITLIKEQQAVTESKQIGTANYKTTSKNEQKKKKDLEENENMAEDTEIKPSQSKQDINDNDNNNLSEDDDVTIVPAEEMEIEQIEIYDDEDDEPNLEHSSVDKKQHNESLLCDEQILISSSSSLSNNSLDQNSVSVLKSPNNENSSVATTTTPTPLLKKTLMIPPVLTSNDESQTNILEMLSNFNMLGWKERIGTPRGTNLKFQINEFNLIQLYEKNMPNKRIHTAYEKPIYERESSHRRNEDDGPPTYYACRRCNVQGPAVDFLAPEFCSLACLKRDCRSRKRKGNHLGNPLNSNKTYVNNDAANLNDTPPPLSYIRKPEFDWARYTNAMAAPISLFLNPFPTGPNNFLLGMKLEAIDPENCSLFCVCTIVDTMGYRLKLSFDGYDNMYDFWVNADSMDIFPPGWCYRTNRILQPPKGITANKFNWAQYVNKEKASIAPRILFTHLNSSSMTPRNPFKIGMYLEAEDLNVTGKLCVASVADVLDDRIRIHFDGWDNCYDIIVDINSPYIHPCGWHQGRQHLVVPPDCDNANFNWNDYIRQQGTGEAASEELFAPREPIDFKPNMKLEVVDPRNPSLIRPATVVSHKGHRVKLHLDGWPSNYCFWLEDDSPDLHPISWCDATCHDLEPPPGFVNTKVRLCCPIDGCRGIGNSKNAFLGVHSTRDACPYATENWSIVVEKPRRVKYENIVRRLTKQAKQCQAYEVPSSIQPRLSDKQILKHMQMLDNIKTHNVAVQQDKLPFNFEEIVEWITMEKSKQKEKNESEYPTTSTSQSSSSSSCCCKRNLGYNALSPKLKILREFVEDYGPRFQIPFFYTIWENNFTFDADEIKINPLHWSTTEVAAFIELHLKCRNTASLFINEDIDGEAFLLLQHDDLTGRMGLKLRRAVEIYVYIWQLRALAILKFGVK